ncbi:MAG: hypothetical protein EOP87_17900, partial [Verrucomicrobiaceae bacterium]
MLSTTSTHAQEQEARLLRDVNREPGVYYGNIEWIMPVRKGAVFPRYTPEHGIELWTTNGSPIGTRLLKDFVPGQQGSTPVNPMAFGEGVSSKVAFNLSSDSEDGLWITDGTENGTTRIFQNESGASHTFVNAEAGTTAGVFFEADVPFTLPNGLIYDRQELLFSDGTAAGSHSLNSIRDESEPAIYDPGGYITTGQWCYFIANSDEEIWRSDGTAAGTQLLHKLPDVEFQEIAVAGERLFIPMAIDRKLELWTSSLTGGELTRMAPPQGANWESIYQIHTAGDKVILQVEAGSQLELWASDGTTAGTCQLPIGTDPDEDWYFDDYIRSWNDSIYFQIQRNNLWELWRSDGTPEGTTVLATTATNRSNFVFFDRATIPDCFYFWVQEEDDRFTLWRTQGTSASTRPVKGVPSTEPYDGISPLAQTKSGETFYIAAQGTTDEGVWKLRGKNGGARRMTQAVKSTGNGIAPAPLNALPYEMLGGDLLAFVNTGTDHELWRMKPDGRRAKAIWKSPPLVIDSSSVGFHGTNSRGAIFSVIDGLGIRQVWLTDGTSAGTRLLGDHGTDTADANPNDFVKIGDRWIYSTIGVATITTSSIWI